MKEKYTQPSLHIVPLRPGALCLETSVPISEGSVDPDDIGSKQFGVNRDTPFSADDKDDENF